jgi:hypothetical protein
VGEGLERHRGGDVCILVTAAGVGRVLHGVPAFFGGARRKLGLRHTITFDEEEHFPGS